jgi:transcriptional regulator with XRE-family HTH domain
MFKNRLAAERKRLGLKQFEVANALGISDSAYGMYERGISKMTVENLLALESHFGFDISHVITGEINAVTGGKLLDWSLLETIHVMVADWAALNDLILSPEKQIKLLKVLYLHLASENVLDKQRVYEILAIAA